MPDKVFIRICGYIFSNSSKPIKKITRLNSKESVYANISNVGPVLILPIFDIAMLFDLLTTGAVIKFITYFYSYQFPLQSS